MKRYLNQLQQRKLLEAARGSSDPMAQRDYHWMASMILTGMRVQEFSCLTVPLVRQGLQIGWLISRKEHCKGRRKCNEYLVTAELRRHLEALIKLSDELARDVVQPEGVDQPLIWGRDVAGHASALSVRSYQSRLKQWAGVAGLDPRISPHWLRHTRGMNVITRSRGKNPLVVAQMALNHDSLKSTGIYLRMSREDFEQEIQQIDGGRVSKQLARRMAAGGAAA